MDSFTLWVKKCFTCRLTNNNYNWRNSRFRNQWAILLRNVERVSLDGKKKSDDGKNSSTHLQANKQQLQRAELARLKSGSYCRVVLKVWGLDMNKKVITEWTVQLACRLTNNNYNKQNSSFRSQGAIVAWYWKTEAWIWCFSYGEHFQNCTFEIRELSSCGIERVRLGSRAFHKLNILSPILWSLSSVGSTNELIVAFLYNRSCIITQKSRVICY